MLVERRVESAAAEQAKVDIRLMYDDYRLAQSIRKSHRGRIRTDDLAVRQHQLIVAGVVSVAERFSLLVLVGCGGNEKKARDWEGQIKEWNALDIDIQEACPSLSAIRGFYEARTAIAHGGGCLTIAQSTEPRRTRVLDCLRAAGVQLSQRCVVVDKRTADACVVTCMRFVDEIEAVWVG